MTKSNATITALQKEQLLERILASAVFCKSPRLSAFLRYICKLHLEAQDEAINEQKIGVHVFSRPEGYHVGEDSIVRSQARFLRQRLSEYFSTCGKQEEILLSIPKGAYVPVFCSRCEVTHEAYSETTEPGAELSEEHNAEVRTRRLPWKWAVAMLACALAALGAWGLHGLLRPVTPVERFWDSFFDAHRQQILVPSDSTLVLLQKMSGREFTLGDYLSRRYLVEPASAAPNPLWHSISTSQYTSLTDLTLFDRLQRFSSTRHRALRLLYARDLTVEELKTSNAILLGGRRSNPWLELVGPAMHFTFGYDYSLRENYILTRNPGRGEQPRYDEANNGTPHVAYGVLAYLPSLDGAGSNLLIGGTSRAATEATGEFLMGPQFNHFLEGIQQNKSIPHFELLLSLNNINGDASTAKIVCFHKLD